VLEDSLEGEFSSMPQAVIEYKKNMFINKFRKKGLVKVSISPSL
jgi:hypothetical protein